MIKLQNFSRFSRMSMMPDLDGADAPDVGTRDRDDTHAGDDEQVERRRPHDRARAEIPR